MRERDQDTIVRVLLQQNAVLQSQISLMRTNKTYLLKLYAEVKEENQKLKARRWYWPF